MSTFKRTKVIELPVKNPIVGTVYPVTNKDEAFFGSISVAHLYFLSDDEIKEGDWYYSTFNDHQPKIQQRKGEWRTCFNQYKIIATTDVTLGAEEDELYPEWHRFRLPEPSQGFIKKYCEKGGIDEVMVEYENGYIDNKPVSGGILKVSSDNTITIKPVKDSWSREEVEALFYKYIEDNNQGCVFETDEEWIKKNL